MDKGMINYFSTHLYAFWFTAGFILLGVELLVLGFSTGFVLFLGLAALLTGGLLWFEILPATWMLSIACFAMSSVIISALLWKPFKRLEKKSVVAHKDNSSDFVGYEFRLQDAITQTNPGKTRYSGIEWRVEIDQAATVSEIQAGTQVKVVSLDAGKFRVVPTESN